MLDLLKCIGFILSVLLLGIFIAYSIEWVGCSSYQKVTGRETTMSFGCFVKDDNVWYSRKEFEFKQAGFKED